MEFVGPSRPVREDGGNRTRATFPTTGPTPSKVVVMMGCSEQAERIRALVASLSADRAERERLKREADEAVAQFHRAVQELLAESKRARRRACF
jgi:hypothetical protein